MELVYKKKRAQPIDDKVTVPCTREMKSKLDNLKKTLDVNEMVRDFLDRVIKETEAGKHLT